MVTVEGLSFGTFSQVTMRSLGMLIMPSVSETNVQGKIQYLLNSTNIVPTEDERIISDVFSGVNMFAEVKLVHFMICFGTIPIACGMVMNVYEVLSKSKHSLFHCLEGLLPIVLCTIYMISAHTFSVIAWEKPIYIFGSMSFFYSLNASRVIIATVTKKKFSIFIDFHLSLPIILGIILFPLNAMALDLKEETLCIGLILLNGFTYFWYIVNVIKQITGYLGIYCLTIKNKTD